MGGHEPITRERAGGKQVRIVVHDYAGHPFQVQLSRQLAARGHDVLHLYCSSLTSSRGAVSLRPGDPATLAIEPVDSGVPLAMYDPVARLRHERRYGRVVAGRLARWAPDAVLSANAPLLAQRAILRSSRQAGARFVFWQQDVISAAIDAEARRRIPVAGAALGALASRLERSMLAGSDHVVVISEDFVPILRQWGLDEDAVTVIENWAPLEELATPAGNGWADAHDLVGRTVLLYTGTLGLKHNPGLLLALARSVGDGDDVRVVVISEGLGADWLQRRGRP